MSYTCSIHPLADETPGPVQLRIRDYVIRGSRGVTVTESEMRCRTCTRTWLAERAGAERLPHHSILD